MKETGNRLTVSLWDTRTLSEKVAFDGYIYPPTFPDREKVREPLTLVDNYDSFMIYGFRWIHEKKKEKMPIIQPLKLQYCKLRTRKDNGLHAHRQFTYRHNGKARTRYATQKDQPIPRIETYPFKDGVIYKFFYYCPISRKTSKRARAHTAFNWLSNKTDSAIRLVKTVKTAKRYNRKTPTITVKDALDNKHDYEMILYRLTATGKESGLSLILYELEFKPGYTKHEEPNTFNTVRTNHKKLISINYTALMRSEKRISKKWFVQLLNALKHDNPRYAINKLPPELRKIAHRVTTYTDVNPILKADLKC